MTRRSFLQSAGAAALGAAPAKKPNILIILADDLGFSDPGCHGGEIATPNIDKLASNGLRFTQGYSTARCVPSRATLLTGYYSQQVGMNERPGKLPSWGRFLPHHMKALGYRTYHSGKWQLTPTPPAKVAGFDRSFAFNDQDRFFSPRATWIDDVPQPPVKEGFYATTAIADHGIGFLRDHAASRANDPFLLYLAFTSPHFPLHALQEDIVRYRDHYLEGWDVVRERRWLNLRKAGIVDCALSPLQAGQWPAWNFDNDRLLKLMGPDEVTRAVPWASLSPEQKRFQATKMAVHAAMVTRMDLEIGRVLDQIRAMKQYEDTLVLFISDNGASAEMIVRGDMHDRSAPPGSAKTYLSIGPGWSSAANSPFRYHKSWVHEGGISSPWIMHWPNGIQDRGKLRRDPAHFIDVLPTITEAAGGKPDLAANAPPLPGRSLVPALRKDRVVKRDFLFFHHIGNRAIRRGDMKLVAAGANGPWELYDLARDRCETNDLARRYPEKARELATAWSQRADEFTKQAAS